MKTKKTLSQWLTNKYLLVIRNEDNFAEKTTISFNYAKIIVFITISCILLFSVSFYLSKTILAKWFHPANREMELNRQLIDLSATVDSLAEQINYRDKQLLNMDRVINGDDSYLTQTKASPAAADSLPAKVESADAALDKVAEADVALRQEFERAPTVPTQMVTSREIAMPDVFLFPPLANGLTSGKFDAKINHYGVDIVAKKDEPVKCVADGTVVMASWTSDTGHVMAVQHAGNLISIYKHNSVLLKKMGDVVKAGEIISIIGNSGEITTGPHLHFELWNNGNPVDPEVFISF